MSNPWDRSFKPMPPDLSRLPTLDRERLNKPLVLKPTETYGLVCLFENLAANHPNGRINVAPMHPGADNPLVSGPSVQIDLSDYSGRVPTAAIILTKEHARTTIVAMLQAYRNVGGDIGEVIGAVTAESTPSNIDIRFNFVDDAKE